MTRLWILFVAIVLLVAACSFIVHPDVNEVPCERQNGIDPCAPEARCVQYTDGRLRADGLAPAEHCVGLGGGNP